MYEQGYITEDEYQHAMNEQLTVLEKGTAASNEMYDNAYYVEYAIYDVVTKMLRVEGDLEDNSTNRAAMQRQLSDARAQAEQILADAHAAAQREHNKLLSDAQKELKDLAVTATEKLVLQSDGDAFDQFLDAAERGESHA